MELDDQAMKAEEAHCQLLISDCTWAMLWLDVCFPENSRSNG